MYIENSLLCFLKVFIFAGTCTFSIIVFNFYWALFQSQ